MDIKEIINAIDQEPYYREKEGVLYCADCMDILPQIPKKSIDLMLTDPPYFLPIHSYVGTRDNGYPKRTLADTSILKNFFKEFFQKISLLMNTKGTIYTFCDAQSYPIFYVCMFPHCRHVRLLVWDKKISYNGYTWRHQHELIAWGELEDTERVPTGDGDILRCRGVMQKDRYHPAEKPIKIIEKLINKHTCNIVLDPFVGSGTTIVASNRLNKQWIGIDISEECCDVTVKRLSECSNKIEQSKLGGS